MHSYHARADEHRKVSNLCFITIRADTCSWTHVLQILF